VENRSQCNEKPVRRGEITISLDVTSNRHEEPEAMNHNKRGRRSGCHDSFMVLSGCARICFGLPFRQTEGMIRAYCNRIPAFPDFASVHKRISKPDTKTGENSNSEDEIILAINSAGTKVADRGVGQMRQKRHTRRGFLKIHAGADARTEKMPSSRTADDHSHGASHPPEPAEQASQKGKAVRVLADGAYDSENSLSYLYHSTDALPAIKARKASSIRTKCHPGKKSVLAQIFSYGLRKAGVSYGDRWVAGCVFSASKRMFGRYVMAHKRKHMINELRLKAEL